MVGRQRGATAELSRLIFKYFDRDNDARWHYEEVREAVRVTEDRELTHDEYADLCDVCGSSPAGGLTEEMVYEQYEKDPAQLIRDAERIKGREKGQHLSKGESTSSTATVHPEAQTLPTHQKPAHQHYRAAKPRSPLKSPNDTLLRDGGEIRSSFSPMLDVDIIPKLPATHIVRQSSRIFEKSDQEVKENRPSPPESYGSAASAIPVSTQKADARSIRSLDQSSSEWYTALEPSSLRDDHREDTARMQAHTRGARKQRSTSDESSFDVVHEWASEHPPTNRKKIDSKQTTGKSRLMPISCIKVPHESLPLAGGPPSPTETVFESCISCEPAPVAGPGRHGFSEEAFLKNAQAARSGGRSFWGTCTSGPSLLHKRAHGTQVATDSSVQSNAPRSTSSLPETQGQVVPNLASPTASPDGPIGSRISPHARGRQGGMTSMHPHFLAYTGKSLRRSPQRPDPPGIPLDPPARELISPVRQQGPRGAPWHTDARRRSPAKRREPSILLDRRYPHKNQPSLVQASPPFKDAMMGCLEELSRLEEKLSHRFNACPGPACRSASPQTAHMQDSTPDARGDLGLPRRFVGYCDLLTGSSRKANQCFPRRAGAGDTCTPDFFESSGKVLKQVRRGSKSVSPARSPARLFHTPMPCLPASRQPSSPRNGFLPRQQMGTINSDTCNSLRGWSPVARLPGNATPPRNPSQPASPRHIAESKYFSPGSGRAAAIPSHASFQPSQGKSPAHCAPPTVQDEPLVNQCVHGSPFRGSSPHPGGDSHIPVHNYRSIVKQPGVVTPGPAGFNTDKPSHDKAPAIPGNPSSGPPPPNSNTVSKEQVDLASNKPAAHTLQGVPMGYLGIEIRARLPDELVPGVKVFRTAVNSPAAACGLLPNDVVTRINGVEVNEPEEFVCAAAKLKPGDEAKLAVLRPCHDGSSDKFTVCLIAIDRRPQADHGSRSATALELPPMCSGVEGREQSLSDCDPLVAGLQDLERLFRTNGLTQHEYSAAKRLLLEQTASVRGQSTVRDSVPRDQYPILRRSTTSAYTEMPKMLTDHRRVSTSAPTQRPILVADLRGQLRNEATGYERVEQQQDDNQRVCEELPVESRRNVDSNELVPASLSRKSTTDESRKPEVLPEKGQTGEKDIFCSPRDSSPSPLSKEEAQTLQRTGSTDRSHDPYNTPLFRADKNGIDVHTNPEPWKKADIPVFQPPPTHQSSSSRVHPFKTLKHPSPAHCRASSIKTPPATSTSQVPDQPASPFPIPPLASSSPKKLTTPPMAPVVRPAIVRMPPRLLDKDQEDVFKSPVHFFGTPPEAVFNLAQVSNEIEAALRRVGRTSPSSIRHSEYFPPGQIQYPPLGQEYLPPGQRDYSPARSACPQHFTTDEFVPPRVLPIPALHPQILPFGQSDQLLPQYQGTRSQGDARQASKEYRQQHPPQGFGPDVSLQPTYSPSSHMQTALPIHEQRQHTPLLQSLPRRHNWGPQPQNCYEERAGPNLSEPIMNALLDRQPAPYTRLTGLRASLHPTLQADQQLSNASSSSTTPPPGITDKPSLYEGILAPALAGLVPKISSDYPGMPRVETRPASPPCSTDRLPHAREPMRGSYRERLISFYHRYRPDKLPSVMPTMREYAGQEETVLAILVSKYGPEPASIFDTPLADGWVMCESQSVDLFYVNTATNEKTWVRPVDLYR